MTLKPNIQSVIQQFYEAGIQVKVVTGDNTVTTKAIEMAGLKNAENVMEGEAFMKLNEVEMLKAIHNTTFNPYVSKQSWPLLMP
jgi:Ca2+-transporting ATPase